MPHSENCIEDSLAHQYNHSIASDAAVDQIDSGQTYLHQTTGTGNKKIDFKYDLPVCQTSPSPASHKIIKKTVATGLAHHISEVIKLSLAFKTQLIFRRHDTPKYRNSIGSSLGHNDYVQCRHCSNFERDRPNLSSEFPASTAPMKLVEKKNEKGLRLYHGSATGATVNTPGPSKSSECRRPSNLTDFPKLKKNCEMDYQVPRQPPDEWQASTSAATQLHKWQPPEYPTRMVGDSRPSMQPTNDYHQGTQGMGRMLGLDSRPPGQPQDNCHRWTSQPLGLIKLMGDGRTPGQPPDKCHRWTPHPLGFTKLMGDGRAPGEPPDHEGTSHPMDSIREMGDVRSPAEPADHNTILGEYRPSGRPLTEYCTDNSLILLRSTSSNESTQVISKSRIENNPHLNLHRTSDLSNGRFLPVLTKLEVAVLTDYGAQMHHKWSSQVKDTFIFTHWGTLSTRLITLM